MNPIQVPNNGGKHVNILGTSMLIRLHGRDTGGAVSVFEGQVQFHDGDAELTSGLSVHRIGGHTDGLQAVQMAAATTPSAVVTLPRRCSRRA